MGIDPFTDQLRLTHLFHKVREVMPIQKANVVLLEEILENERGKYGEEDLKEWFLSELKMCKEMYERFLEAIPTILQAN